MREVNSMDLFMKILLLLIGLGFAYVGFRFLISSKKIIQAIQKYKYHQTAEPRKQELIMAKVMGSLLLLIGLYYAIMSIIALSS